jgi:hypothetical protein
LNPDGLRIDAHRTCEICNGPVTEGNEIGICRTTRKCREENEKRSRGSATECRICGSPLESRTKIGICRTNEICKREGKKVHDRHYHQSRKKGEKKPKKQKTRADDASWLLEEDGIIDETAVQIAASGKRRVRLTQNERIATVKLMLRLGIGVREMCDNLHVHPSVVREILDGLGYECVLNTHIVGSKVMIILPKDRMRKPKILDVQD